MKQMANRRWTKEMLEILYEKYPTTSNDEFVQTITLNYLDYIEKTLII